MVDFCWDLYGKPTTNQVSLEEEDGSLSPILTSITSILSILGEEFCHIVSLQFHFVTSFATTPVQINTPIACLATQKAYVIDLGEINHMTGIFYILSI